jgi:hypothetical protein
VRYLIYIKNHAKILISLFSMVFEMGVRQASANSSPIWGLIFPIREILPGTGIKLHAKAGTGNKL